VWWWCWTLCESVPTEVVGGDFPDLVVVCGGFSLGGGVLERRFLVCCSC
jgi:hypothetical protein